MALSSKETEQAQESLSPSHRVLGLHMRQVSPESTHMLPAGPPVLHGATLLRCLSGRGGENTPAQDTRRLFTVKPSSQPQVSENGTREEGSPGEDILSGTDEGTGRLWGQSSLG